jgi:hypothetical protein
MGAKLFPENSRYSSLFIGNKPQAIAYFRRQVGSHAEKDVERSKPLILTLLELPQISKILFSHF